MKLPIGLIVLPIVLFLSPSCSAYTLSGLFTSAMDLLDYGEKLLGFLPNRTEETGPSEIKEEFDRFIIRFEKDINAVRNDTKRVETLLKEGLKDLSGKNSLVETQRYLQLAAGGIADKFHDLKRTQRRLNQGKPDFLKETFDHHTSARTYIEELWSGIKHTFLDEIALSHLADNFIKSKMVHENVCAAEVSQLQLLEQLFIFFQATSSEVLLSKHIIYNYFEQFHLKEDKEPPSSEVHAIRRKDWNDDFYDVYVPILDIFKTQLNNIASKMWRCDPIKFDESNYLELKAFTKYYIRGADILQDFGYCGFECAEKHHNRPQNILDDCMSIECSKMNSSLRSVPKDVGFASEIRWLTRDCPKPLADCKLKSSGTGAFYVCIKEGKTNYKRYTAIQSSDKCIFSRESSKIAATLDPSVVPFDCVCPEESYYISTLHSDAEADHVIVGAQIQMSKDNILHIKVKQGKPMNGGVIHSNSAKWLNAPLNKSATQQISWGDCDEFDLSEITFPNDRVIVGLGFTGCVKGRIHLRVTTKAFDFKTGTVGDDVRIEKLIRGTKLYSVNNTGVPIEGRDQNLPIKLKDGDYVKLALSSLEEDGGQTTVPFIDTQEVVPKVPVPLSGASLVLRTQPGYGGFLGIQVFTYNMSSFTPPRKRQSQTEIDELLWRL